MFDKKFGVFLSVFSISIAVGACKKDDDKKSGGTLTSTFQPSRVSQAALHQASLALSTVLPSNIHLAPPAIGRSNGAELESFSFRLQRVQFCGTLATNGTGTNCTGKELSMYSEPNPADYNAFLPADAIADTTNYTNFLDKEALKSIASGITYNEDHIGSFDSVLMYWYHPFKAKASMTLANGTKLYTKAPTDYASNNKTGLDVTMQSLVQNMTTAPAEEGVFFLPNGGTYFKFQKPFEITQADVDNKTNFKVVFAFDPDSIITGMSMPYDPSAPAPDWLSGMADRTNGYMIQAPFLQIAPVVAREGETIMREVYLLRAADSSHDVRVSIYYVKEETDQPIRAVTTTTIKYEQEIGLPVDFQIVYSAPKNADGSYDLKDWAGLNVVGGFKRATTPGQIEGTVTHQFCEGNLSSSGCEGTTGTANYTYSLVAVGAVESDLTMGYEPAPVE